MGSCFGSGADHLLQTKRGEIDSLACNSIENSPLELRVMGSDFAARLNVPAEMVRTSAEVENGRWMLAFNLLKDGPWKVSAGREPEFHWLVSESEA